MLFLAISPMGENTVARRWRVRNVAICVVVLIGSGSLPKAVMPAASQGVAQDSNSSVKERDRLAERSVRLRSEGKLLEAITAAELMLRVEKAVLHVDADELLISLDWLGQLHLEHEDFAAARRVWMEALELLRVQFGEAHWKVTDARLFVEDVERLAEMSRPQRQKLAEANRLGGEISTLDRAGRYDEAATLARRVVAIRIEVQGRRHRDYARSLNNLAMLLESHGDHAAARPLLEQALALNKDVLGERHPIYARSLNNLALVLDSQGQLSTARPLYETALAIHKETLGERHPETAAILGNLAALLHAQGDHVRARPLCERALAIRKEVLGERHPDYALSLNNLAVLLLAQEDHATARSLLEKALAIRKEILGERHPDYASSLNNLASALEAGGDFAAARPLYERALAIRKEVLGEWHPDYAQSLNNLGNLLDALADYSAARPLLERAIAIRKQALGELHPRYADSLSNLGHLLESQGNYASARSLYERTLAIRKETQGEHHPDYARSLNNLATLYNRQGNYAAASPLCEQVLAIYKQAGRDRQPDYALGLNNLAAVLCAQEDYVAARPLYEQALEICKEVLGERHPRYAVSLDNLGGVLHAQGDPAGARSLFERALAIRRQVLGERHPDSIFSLINLASLLGSQGDIDAAGPLFEQAIVRTREVLGDHHPLYAQSLNNLAMLRWSQGDNAGATPLLEQALALRERELGEVHPDYASSLSNLALVRWSQQDYARATALAGKALAIASRNLDLAATVQSERQQLSMSQRLRGRLDGYLSVGSLANLSPEDAYRSVLTAKGSVFLRQWRLRAQRRRLLTDPRSEAARCFAAYQECLTRLATVALACPGPGQVQAWKDEVSELTRRKDGLEARLTQLDSSFPSAEAAARPGPEQVQAAIPPGVALIDLLVYASVAMPERGQLSLRVEHRLLAFVIRPDRPVVRMDLGPAAPVARAIRDWRSILVGRSVVAPSRDPAMALRRLIWEPVEPHLDGITSVLVSPDGPIGLVPLHALPGREAGTYLIEERSMTIVPVPAMLVWASDRRTEPGGGDGEHPPDPASSLLVVGDIDYGGEPGAESDRRASRSAAIFDRTGWSPRFAPLAATREEILEIRDAFAQEFPRVNVDLLRGGQATESAFRHRAPGHRYFHLATHGYFAPEELRSAIGPGDPKTAGTGIDLLGGAGVVGYHPGLLSGIVLAGANRRPTPAGQDDGILTATEVAELDLSGVELAVLSACETGLGEVAGGEGLLGLQRAFQMAGTRAAVASLWSVNDEATGLLIAEFYRNFWKKRLPKGQALRQAQLKMLQGELRPGGARTGRARGLRRPEDSPDYRRPRYWAAFVLSGDWR